MYNNSFLYGSNNLLPKLGLLSSLKKINWSTFLGNAQKTLGVINQAIPIVYQVKPIVGNAKTLFRIANSLKDTDYNNVNKKNKNSSNGDLVSINNSNPIFYL